MENAKFALSRRTMILLVCAVAFCVIGLLGAVGTSQAALVYQSQVYEANMAQTHLGVALTEKTAGEETVRVVNVGDTTAVDLSVSEGTEAGTLLPVTVEKAESANGDETTSVYMVLNGDKAMIPGKTYDEEISVQNASNMGQYVRVTIRKYWMDADGNKMPTIDPKLIELDFDNTGTWILSEDESTDERYVFYLLPQLGSDQGAAPSAPLVSGIRLAKSVIDNPLPKGNYQIALYAQVDSVQTENTLAAAKSAWGVDLASGSLATVGASWASGSVSGEEE